MPTPRISAEDAQAACREPWSSRQEAAEQVRWLAAGGWRIRHREADAEFGQGSGWRILATVLHPDTDECPGDVMYYGRAADPGE